MVAWIAFILPFVRLPKVFNLKWKQGYDGK